MPQFGGTQFFVFYGFERFFVRHVKPLKIVSAKRATKTAALMTVKSMAAE